MGGVIDLLARTQNVSIDWFIGDKIKGIPNLPLAIILIKQIVNMYFNYKLGTHNEKKLPMLRPRK